MKKKGLTSFATYPELVNDTKEAAPDLVHHSQGGASEYERSGMSPADRLFHDDPGSQHYACSEYHQRYLPPDRCGPQQARCHAVVVTVSVMMMGVGVPHVHRQGRC